VHGNSAQQTLASTQAPHVALLATGGTIAMRFSESAGGAVPDMETEGFIPPLPPESPAVTLEQIGPMPSAHHGIDTLWTIRNRVGMLIDEPDVCGVVVTHGTDTMEETAYLLDATVPGDKPIVLTGAMRTQSDLGYEGRANLESAIRVAASTEARGLGAVVVCNDEIHAARHVTKMHTLSPATFQSPGWGPLGRVAFDTIRIAGRTRRSVLPWQGLEPNVTLIKLCVGQQAEILDCLVTQGMRGIVIEAFGSGRVPPWWVSAIEQVRAQGLPVVIASRCPSGPLGDEYGYKGAYRTLAGLGCLFADELSGQKARIRLMVVLAAAQSTHEIAELWTQ